MPDGDPQAGELWTHLADYGLREWVTVVGRATPHDMATMPGMIVVYGEPDGKLRTITLRNFVAQFAYKPTEIPEPKVEAVPYYRFRWEKPEPGGTLRMSDHVWDTKEGRWIDAPLLGELRWMWDPRRGAYRLSETNDYCEPGVSPED